MAASPAHAPVPASGLAVHTEARQGWQGVALASLEPRTHTQCLCEAPVKQAQAAPFTLPNVLWGGDTQRLGHSAGGRCPREPGSGCVSRLT